MHHALLNSGLEPQPVSLTVTLPLSEYYDGDCQRNEENIRRKRENLMRELVLNKGRAFTVTDVKVMPESLPAAFSRLAELKPGTAETTLIIDLGGTTLDAGVIVGQFDDISAVHGNPSVGVSQVTRAAAGALRAADSETSALIADTVIRNRNDRQYLQRVINDAGKIDDVLNKITEAITSLGARVTSELTAFRNVNRVFLVGGGASLIEEAIRQAWPLAPDRIEVIGDPQLALAREIALYNKEGTDIAAMATISTISQPLRGDFIRTAATAGAVMYQTDARLPALIPVFFDGHLSAIRLCAVMALVAGTWSSLSGLPDEPDGGVAALAMSPDTEYQRRRYTLTLLDDRSSERVERVLTGVSSRLRGELLRNLIITGLALHTTAPELPRLLASMPVPPGTVSELQVLVQQMAGTAGVSKAAVPEKPAQPAAPVTGEATWIKKNMRRAFGD